MSVSPAFPTPTRVTVVVAEHRDSVRHNCAVPSTCHTLPPSEGGMGTIQDVSESGVGLVVDRRFERGTLLGLELPGTGEYLLASVVRSTRRPDGRWLLGCRFRTDQLNADQVARLAGGS